MAIRLGIIDRLSSRFREVHQTPENTIISVASAWADAQKTVLTEPVETTAWHSLLEHAANANSARPSATWLRVANEHIAEIGDEAFKQVVITMIGSFAAASRQVDFGELDAMFEISITPAEGVTLLRGFIWCCSRRDDPRIAQAIGNVIEAGLKKIPGVGPRSLKLANAGIFTLGAMPGMNGVEQLVRLRQRVVYAQARSGMDDALNAAAVRLGVSREDLDDMATPTFDLVDGRRKFDFPPFSAELITGGASGVEVRWFGSDGAVRRTEPVDIKSRYPEERAALKLVADDLRKALTAQRERLERLFLAERLWSFSVWRERYLDQPLLSDLTRRLIWSFEIDGKEQLGAWLTGEIVDAADRPLNIHSPETKVRIWHPIHSDIETTSSWQLWLERHELRQPFKQAHREIYVLTDAERTTATYSNRFAGHIFRQHQFRALAQGRGWDYQLQGDFDFYSVPTIELPRWGLTVEFLVEIVESEEMSNLGIALFVATDQVRFRRQENVPRNRYAQNNNEIVPLTEIPALPFSEMMRDVDLFVGVTSVGADPTWNDRGPLAIREYWHHFAFGELTASAESRKAILERLLPRLEISSRCTFNERFLTVRGDLRTYRIHLGSGHIHMEPNNQYLCIVPGQKRKLTGPELFLPFEGDALLSTILSKALMLSNDRAITDPTITRQISPSVNPQ